MDPRNPCFMSAVNRERNRFIELMGQAKLLHTIYPSKHFFERVVERNLEAVDVLRMLLPVIKEFRETTYNERTYCVRWKNHRLFAMITVGPVSNRRQITLKTMYDQDKNDMDYDVTVTI